MAKRLSASTENLTFKEIATTHNYRVNSLRLYFSPSNPTYEQTFFGLTTDEVSRELEVQILEVERDTCLNILAATEAMFRVDYSLRCTGRKKDDLSRKFRSIYTHKGEKVSLEETIFAEWKNYLEVHHSESKKRIISELISAFKYRHWLAHGRYWTLKANRYDSYNLFSLVKQLPDLLIIGV